MKNKWRLVATQGPRKIKFDRDLAVRKQDLTKWEKFRVFVQLLIERFKISDIANSSKAITYYVLLSLFPLIILIGNFLPLMHFNVNAILSYVFTVLPTNVADLIGPFIKKTFTESNGGLLSFGAIAVLWTASRAINIITTSFNKAYGVGQVQGYIITRLLAVLFTLLLVIAMMALTIVFAFGQQLLEWLAHLLFIPDSWIRLFQAWKWPVIFIAMFVLVSLLYYWIPNVKMKFRSVLGGTVLTTVSWIALAQGFGLYMKYFGTSWNSYGTIGSFIVLLLWLNYSCTILMAGAVFNATVEEFSHGHIRRSKGRVFDLVQKRQNKHR